MTKEREEAINYLKNSMAIGEDDGSRYHNEILEFTIKALEQETCNDAVSRKAVVEYIKNSDAELGHDSENEMFVEDILNMPPATPTRKKGKWVTKFHGFPPEPSTFCSECGFDRDYNIRPRYYHKIKFCPICGAEMEGEE